MCWDRHLWRQQRGLHVTVKPKLRPTCKHKLLTPDAPAGTALQVIYGPGSALHGQDVSESGNPPPCDYDISESIL